MRSPFWSSWWSIVPGDEHHRRSADDEAFKYQIVADQARITTKVEILHDMVKAEIGQLKNRVDKVEEKYDTLKEAIAGGLTRPGIMESNRNLVKDIAKLFGIIAGTGFVLFKIASPLYDVWVTRWIPQKIATSVAQQPEEKSKIVRKSISIKPVPVDSQIKKQ